MKNISTLTKQLDLTKGDVSQQIIRFSIPLLIGNLAQQLYNTVDAIVVSKYVGDTALGAVGVVGPALQFLIMVYVAIATGASILVGQYYGAKDRENLSKTIGSTYLLGILSSLVLTVVAVLLTEPILLILNTPADIFPLAASYMRTLFYGILGLAMYNLLTANLRALGDSFSPLIYLLIATVLNIILDIVFVKYFYLSTFGVAIATVIAQSVSAILCSLRLSKMQDVFDFKLKYFKFDREIAKRILGLGMPNAITQGIFSISMMILQGLTNSFGSIVVTANTAVMRVDGFVMMPNFTFGIAASTFTAQNIGAKNIKRVFDGARASIKIGFMCSISLALILVFWGGALANIFTDTQIIIDYASAYMKILAVGYIAFTATQVYGGVMRGAGDTISPMWISLITVVAVRVPLSYLLVHLSKTATNPLGDPKMMFVALAISWVIGATITTLVYKSGIWKKKANIENI